MEVARNIYSEIKNEENERKLSEVYNKLGELGIEGGYFSFKIVKSFFNAVKYNLNSLIITSNNHYFKLKPFFFLAEQYSQAIDDFESSLVLQLKHFTKDDRRLAHTHYQLGIVYAFDKHHSKALSSMKKAVVGLNYRNGLYKIFINPSLYLCHYLMCH